MIELFLIVLIATVASAAGVVLLLLATGAALLVWGAARPPMRTPQAHVMSHPELVSATGSASEGPQLVQAAANEAFSGLGTASVADLDARDNARKAPEAPRGHPEPEKRQKAPCGPCEAIRRRLSSFLGETKK